MSTYFSLLSTLSLGECASRLENVRKQETIDGLGIYHPIRCEVQGIAKTIIFFNLRTRKDIHAMFVFGRLYEIEGKYKTLITYSVGDPNVPSDLDDETNERLDRVNKNIGIFFLLILCFSAGYFTANLNAITIYSICSWIATIILGLLLLRTGFIKHKRNKDVEEMVFFIKETLEAQ